MKRINRRDFLRYSARATAAVGAGGSLFGPRLPRVFAQTGCPGCSYVPTSTAYTLPPPSCTVPAPGDSGIDHIVVIMMENRSFDHFAGWVPGADGWANAPQYPDSQNPPVFHPVKHVSDPCIDPAHAYVNFYDDYGAAPGQLDPGTMDGFLRENGDNQYVISYYLSTDLGYFAELANNYTVCDHYFASILSQTFPNRMFSMAAQTDRLDNNSNPADASMATIWDRLHAALGDGSGFYYTQGDADLIGLWPRLCCLRKDWETQFITDAENGRLPPVSYLEPLFGSDYHPCFGITGTGTGEEFLMRSIRAVQSHPAWLRTVIIVNFDEGGGFFDHVTPPKVNAVTEMSGLDQADVRGQVPLGFRVPAMIVSPLTAGQRVNKRLFDHTSILKFIEWRWNLAPLTSRDADPAIDNLVCAIFG